MMVDFYPLGETIRMIRKEKGMTLKDVANATEMSISHWSDVERCTQNPSINALFTLCYKAFDIEPYKLLLIHYENSLT